MVIPSGKSRFVRTWFTWEIAWPRLAPSVKFPAIKNTRLWLMRWISPGALPVVIWATSLKRIWWLLSTNKGNLSNWEVVCNDASFNLTRTSTKRLSRCNWVGILPVIAVWMVSPISLAFKPTFATRSQSGKIWISGCRLSASGRNLTEVIFSSKVDKICRPVASKVCASLPWRMISISAFRTGELLRIKPRTCPAKRRRRISTKLSFLSFWVTCSTKPSTLVPDLSVMVLELRKGLELVLLPKREPPIVEKT